MRTLKNKLLIGLTSLTVLLGLASCMGNTNDRTYTMNEIEGTYLYSEYSTSGWTYDYYLVIDDGYGKAYRESYSFEGDRYGMPHDIDEMFSGTVTLTEKNIKIGNYTGYIKSSKITINDRTYTRK